MPYGFLGVGAVKRDDCKEQEVLGRFAVGGQRLEESIRSETASSTNGQPVSGLLRSLLK